VIGESDSPLRLEIVAKLLSAAATAAQNFLLTVLRIEPSGKICTPLSQIRMNA